MARDSAFLGLYRWRLQEDRRKSHIFATIWVQVRLYITASRNYASGQCLMPTSSSFSKDR